MTFIWILFLPQFVTEQEKINKYFFKLILFCLFQITVAFQFSEWKIRLVVNCSKDEWGSNKKAKFNENSLKLVNKNVIKHFYKG